MIRMYLKEGLAHISHFWNSVACTQSEVSSYTWKDHCCIDTGNECWRRYTAAQATDAGSDLDHCTVDISTVIEEVHRQTSVFHLPPFDSIRGGIFAFASASAFAFAFTFHCGCSVAYTNTLTLSSSSKVRVQTGFSLHAAAE